MKIRIIYNTKLLDKLSILMPIAGITLYPFIILREEYKKDTTLLNHELIHIEQQRELYIIPFYILYAYYYLLSRIKGKQHNYAYRNIPFEKEAYRHQLDQAYIKNKRIKHNWRKYA